MRWEGGHLELMKDEISSLGNDEIRDQDARDTFRIS